MVTLKDVADAAGVSPSTASAALRGMDIVKPLTRRKVIRQAQRLHYSTNVSARALRSGRSGIFTLIVPDLENGYYARLANSLSNRLFARNLKLIIQVSQYDKAKELRQIQELRSSMCDGLFVCSTHNSAREIQQVANGLPVLLFDDMSVQNQACYDSI
ncbi:MAG: LacI family transcriptional regulator, partial [Bifidobacterium sp.]|nr:LacI family transcriptional regulator [Bifidobacterium sp.]